MPKMKSNSGAKKRFRITNSGKVKHYSQGKAHILNKKTPKRKMHLRQGAYLQSNKQAASMKVLVQKS